MTTSTEALLLSPAEALALQESGEALILDVRDAEDYKTAHIAGAVSVPQMFYHLSKTDDADLQEAKAVFEGLFQKAGVTSETLVILYEDGFKSRFGGSFRGWWWLNFFGHSKAAVLDGGFKAWMSDGLPVDDTEVVPEPSDFKITIDESVLARQQEVLDAIDNPNVILLDNRDAREWYCEGSSPYDTPGEDFSPRRGRIPGATWLEWTDLMDDSDSPTFRSPEEIREIMKSQGMEPDSDIIIYCFKGSRASNTFAALKYAGFTKLRNYLGSWYEWAADESLPIETGSR
ncbi:MAG: sulfurtransferase [Rubripirellula sp.]